MHPAATPEAINDIAARLTAQNAIGIDTEFLRERTYHAELCLLQLSWEDHAACVDPLALRDLSALSSALTGPPAV